ncbi:DoxX-like family protein [Thalassobacillus cyri]|uniref:DoxX-like family protein n=1 Tax=Thalassobacillus cyri TaxID=571932 RepID=A0A1H3W1J7_9BACI|nr:DoxX family protein [Thalassobacillus cyri]SDZ81035.1 DoxX-like family protein [Thalassobacillus cyri]
MKKISITYWISTGLLTALMLFSAITNILSHPDAVTLFDHLGYPAYLIPFIGVAKLLGVIAILVPGFPRITEWAYAGFAIDITGAMYSTLAVGDPVSSFLIFYMLLFGSYFFYHKKQQFGTSSDKAIINSKIPV